MAASLKRSRDVFNSDHPDPEALSRDIKKHFRSLPIRPPSLRVSPPAIHTSNQTWGNITTQMLTPIESSDDELLEYEARRLYASEARELEQDSSDGSDSSTRANADWDDEMDLINPTEEPPFANLSPPKSNQHHTQSSFLQPPNFSQPQHRNGANRVPTPIRPTFKNTSDTEMFGTGQAMPRTMLSPTMREDTSPTETGLPSPTSEYADQMETSSPSRQSQFRTPADTSSPMKVGRATSRHGFDGQNEPSIPTGRTPRLYMGYRADCEKCMQRVPGHYSHILWS